MKKFSIILILSFLCFAFSYNNGLKILVLNKLSKYTTEQYPEKIYIQTDKPYYTAGESIWFNTFLVNGVTHTRSGKSKVIYVELLNEQDSIVGERKLFTKSVSVQGDFKLPINLKEGNYFLRAYTNYMRNQPRDYFFKKEIPVVALYSGKTEENSITESKTQENSELPDIDFYPEGGYLVIGLKNKVAVKIKDANLSANAVFGIIEDSEGNKITDFKTSEFGLGLFYLNPQPGIEYRAVITSGDEDILYPLPIPISEGYVMNTSITDKEVIINITTNQKEGLKNTLIIGQQRGIAAFDYTEDKDKNTMLVKIPKSDLIEGVLDIVLFKNSKKPVAERLVYINKKEKISLSVKKTNGTTTGLRDRVNLQIDVRNELGKLIPSTLSMSVTDAELIKPDENAENIKTYLLLNSDLRGKIKSPNYFFTAGDTIKKNQQLDLIMLTHGWRRFTWQEFLENNPKQEFKPEDGIYISGYTLNSKSPFQSKSSETKLTFRKKGFYQENQNTDKYGYFSYGPFVFNDTIDVYLQAGSGISSENPNFKDTNIKFDPPNERPATFQNRIINTFNQKAGITNLETYRKKSRNNVFNDFGFQSDREILDEVKLKGKVKTKEEVAEIKREKRTRMFQPSYRLVVDEMGYQGAGNFMELIGNIPGIRVEKKTTAETSQDVVVTLKGMLPAYFVDNSEVDLAYAKSIHQADIDFIDIMNTGHASAAYGLKAQGVIAIYTKQGSRNGTKIIDKKPGSINFKSEGFYTARDFYAPNYALVDRNRNKADKRTTLYWNPEIITVGFQKSNITFYTSDEKGRFQIEIEGITDTGMPIHSTAYIEVE